MAADLTYAERGTTRLRETMPGPPCAVLGLDVRLTLGWGPVRILAPTRVVYVLDEPDRRGFAYGTLPGHPEIGEELFLVERQGDAVVAEVRAFSRPGRS